MLHGVWRPGRCCQPPPRVIEHRIPCLICEFIQFILPLVMSFRSAHSAGLGRACIRNCKVLALRCNASHRPGEEEWSPWADKDVRTAALPR